MATETRERTDAATNAERATKVDLAKLATKADVAELSAKIGKCGHEIDSIQAELNQIRWLLGAIFVLLIALYGAIFAIALQI